MPKPRCHKCLRVLERSSYGLVSFGGWCRECIGVGTWETLTPKQVAEMLARRRAGYTGAMYSELLDMLEEGGGFTFQSTV